MSKRALWQGPRSIWTMGVVFNLSISPVGINGYGLESNGSFCSSVPSEERLNMATVSAILKDCISDRGLLNEIGG